MNIRTNESLGVIAQKIKRTFPYGCQRILIINLPQVPEEGFDLPSAQQGKSLCFPPYGPGLLSRNLHNAGYEAEILDLNYELLARCTDPVFEYSTWKELTFQKVGNFKPDLIAVSCMYSMSHSSLESMVRYLKKYFPLLPIIVGGVHVSNNTKLILERVPEIDLALKLEADSAFPVAVNFMNGKADEKQLSQLSIIENGDYYSLENRDVPLGDVLNQAPDYGNLPIGDYSNKGRIGAFAWLRLDNPKVGTVLAHRGCRGHCSFCSVSNFNGKGVRGRSIISVVDEMQAMKERYGITHFMWLDDDLFLPNAIELFNEITRRGLNITWDATNGVIAAASSPEMIRAAAESGCIGLAFGIESGDPEILRTVGKPSKVKQFKTVGETLKKYPQIFCKGNLMIGFPGETLRQIKMTIDLALDLALDWYTITSVSFLGGTDMTKDLVKKGVMDESDVLYASFFVSPNGTRRKKEIAEKYFSKFSTDVLNGDMERTPSSDELSDIWFIMDFLLNFRPVLFEKRLMKLEMKSLMFQDVCGRIHDHAMSWLFLGVIHRKLGRKEKAAASFAETKKELASSAFWRVRFEKLGMDKILAEEEALLDNSN